MYQQAIGFSPRSLLSGLKSKSPFAKGQAMQAAAGLDMDRASKNQEFASKQMQDESQQRQQAARNSAQAASNESQERMQRQQQNADAGVFDMGMRFNYAQLANGQQLRLRQALLNNIARDF